MPNVDSTRTRFFMSTVRRTHEECLKEQTDPDLICSGRLGIPFLSVQKLLEFEDEELESVILFGSKAADNYSKEQYIQHCAEAENPLPEDRWDANFNEWFDFIQLPTFNGRSLDTYILLTGAKK